MMHTPVANTPSTHTETMTPPSVLPLGWSVSKNAQEGTSQASIGGVMVSDIVAAYGTATYVMDGMSVRTQCRSYKKALADHYANPGYPIYAGKAHLSIGMCQVITQEDMYLDVVSAGELYTALKAGVAPERIMFNGNNKHRDEITMALRLSVGRIVVDNASELDLIAQCAKEEDKQAQIYIRVVPGIECHTHEYIKTGHDDNKFGVPLTQLDALLTKIRGEYAPYIHLMGLHAHIGSQIFEAKAYHDLAHILMETYNRIRSVYQGWLLPEIDCGGGLGIAYTSEDDPLSIETYLQTLGSALTEACRKYTYPLPRLFIEPGRSLVATAGVTLYQVGTVKQAPGSQRVFVAVDGGMGDNIRPALYQAAYSALVANKLDEAHTHEVRLVGKYCESGDVILKAFQAPESIQSGDTVAVFGTGAYNHAMAMTYNRIGRPPVIWVEDGTMHEMVRRETLEDMVSRDQFLWGAKDPLLAQATSQDTSS